MPTYQYECDSCGHDLEAFQSMTEKKLKKCPKCGKPELKRLIGSGGGVIFKGSGFYETDYKQKSASTADCPANKGSHKPNSDSCACCPKNPNKK
ncbi:MAG: zinc ribbon domain-containing protein [Candidatus Omnitrophica bacterium]|nr:zinc ribbon domain-containing protein [Candidatus Omnitrophota bacterium]